MSITPNVEKIQELLSNGLSNEVVATAVGVHPSYISQLMSQEDFASAVVAKRTLTLAQASSRDRTWDSLEDKLLARLDELVETHQIYKPQDILRAAVVANSAKRRGNSAQENLVINQTVVTLNLPKQIIHSFSKNAVGEVIEANGQTLVSKTASMLMAELAGSAESSSKYDQVRKHLPPSVSVKVTEVAGD